MHLEKGESGGRSVKIKPTCAAERPDRCGLALRDSHRRAVGGPAAAAGTGTASRRDPELADTRASLLAGVAASFPQLWGPPTLCSVLLS